MQRCLGCMREFGSEFGICPHCGYIVGSKAVSKNHLEPGTILQNRYLLGKVLGQGGFGITYIAWDSKIGRAVAVKEYMPNALASRMSGDREVSCFNEEAQQQFDRGLQKTRSETQALARFNMLESVVKVYDCIEENGTAYIIMELLRGRTVKEILAERGKLTFAQTMRIMTPVLQTLDAMHSAGMIHRDVAPDNIFVCDDGRIKLLDFGAARVVSTQNEKTLSVMLKAGFAPVEQYSGKAKQGAFTDVYAASATMYKMLTGEMPPDSLSREKDGSDLAALSRTDAPQSAQETLLHGMAQFVPDRIQSARELLAQLQMNAPKNVAGIDPKAFLHGQKQKQDPQKQTSKGVRIALAAALILCLVIGAVIAVGASRARKEKTDPEEQTESTTQTLKTVSDAAVGDTVVFGEYEQDGDTANGAEELEWLVLDKKAGRVLVITKYCIDQLSYHNVREDVTWSGCTLRSWMNSVFIDKAFSADLLQYLVRTTLQNEDNPQYGTDGGADTDDRVFALSVSQAQTYFDSDASRRAVATDYAEQNGAFVGDTYGTSWWWLRTPGEDGTKAVLVYVDGSIVMRGGERVDIDNDAVRPAMWLRADAPVRSPKAGSETTQATASPADLRKASAAYAAFLAQYDALEYAYVSDVNGDGYPEVIAKPQERMQQFALTYTDKAGLSVLYPNAYSGMGVRFFASPDNCIYYRDDGHTSGTAYYHAAYVYTIDETGFVLKANVFGDAWQEEADSDDAVWELDEKYDKLFDDKLRAAAGDRDFAECAETDDAKQPDACLNAALEIDIAAQRQAYADAKTRLQKAVADAAGQAPQSLFVSDYDRDGAYEAFAFIEDGEKPYADAPSVGTVWFADAQGEANAIRDEVCALEQMDILSCTYHDYFQAPPMGGSSVPTSVWEVRGSDCEQVEVFDFTKTELEIVQRTDSVYLPPDTLVSTLSAFDMSFSDELVDEETGELLGVGHTHKPYFFRDTPQGIREYGGVDMQPSEVEKISGGKALLDLARRDGRKLESIYRRENGIVSFSVSERNGADTQYHCFNALLAEDKLQLLHATDLYVCGAEDDEYLSEGFYAAAASPDFATYPES